MNDNTDGDFVAADKIAASAPHVPPITPSSDDELVRLAHEYLQRGQALLEGQAKRNEQRQELERLRLSLHRTQSELSGIRVERDQLKQARDDGNEVVSQKRAEIARISERLEQTVAQKSVADDAVRRLTEENAQIAGERENLQGQLTGAQTVNLRLQEFEDLVVRTAERLRNALRDTGLVSFQDILSEGEKDTRIVAWTGENLAQILADKRTLQAALSETQDYLEEARSQAARHVQFEQQWDHLTVEERLAFVKAIIPNNHPYARPLERGLSILKTFAKASLIQGYLVQDPSGFQKSRADLDCERAPELWQPLDMAWEALEEARRMVDNQIANAGIRIIRPEAGTPYQPSIHQIVPETANPVAHSVIARCLRAGYAYENRVRVRADVEVGVQSDIADAPPPRQSSVVPETASGSAPATDDVVQSEKSERPESDSLETPDIAQNLADARRDPPAVTAPPASLEDQTTGTTPAERPDWYTPLYEAANQTADENTHAVMEAIRVLLEWPRASLTNKPDVEVMASSLNTLAPAFTPDYRGDKTLDIEWMKAFEKEVRLIVAWMSELGIEVISPRYGAEYDDATMQTQSRMMRWSRQKVNRVLRVGFSRTWDGKEVVLWKAQVTLE